MIKFKSHEDAQYYVFRVVLPTLARNILLDSGYDEENIRISELPDQDPGIRVIEVSSTKDGWETWRNDFYITWNKEPGCVVFGIMKLNSSVTVTPGIDENGLMTEKTVYLNFEGSWIGQQLEKRAAILGRQLQPNEMEEVGQFAGICGLVDATMQYTIDSLRGWSPFANAEEYKMHKMFGSQTPTEPKAFFPEHDKPERYYNPEEEETL